MKIVAKLCGSAEQFHSVSTFGDEGNESLVVLLGLGLLLGLGVELDHFLHENESLLGQLGILRDVGEMHELHVPRLSISNLDPGVGKGTVILNTAGRYTAFAIAVLKIFAVRYYGTQNFGNKFSQNFGNKISRYKKAAVF